MLIRINFVSVVRRDFCLSFTVPLAGAAELRSMELIVCNLEYQGTVSCLLVTVAWVYTI